MNAPFVLAEAPLPYGRDWPDSDLWLDRDGQVHRGDGPYLNSPIRRLHRHAQRCARALRHREQAAS